MSQFEGQAGLSVTGTFGQMSATQYRQVPWELTVNHKAHLCACCIIMVACFQWHFPSYNFYFHFGFKRLHISKLISLGVNNVNLLILWGVIYNSVV